MRLIDADEPRKLISDEMRAAEELGTHDADVSKASLMMALSYINTTLTIDAVPVVRCKDCKWYWINKDVRGYVEGIHWCEENDSMHFEDDYCSYGERKNDE